MLHPAIPTLGSQRVMGNPLQGWTLERNMNPSGSRKIGWAYAWCSTQRNWWSLVQWFIRSSYPELDHPNPHSSVLWPHTMVTFNRLQHASLIGGTLYSQDFVLHQCIFLRSSDTSTLRIHYGCVNCIRASFSPAAPTATNGLASLRSNTSVPPARSLRYQHHKAEIPLSGWGEPTLHPTSAIFTQ